MINSFDDIYICCPAYLVTGGPEALHQLADAINSQGGSAYIVYYFGDSLVEAYVPLKFKHYKVKRAKTAIAGIRNALVVPESNHTLLDQFSFENKFLWWLGWFHFSGNISDISSDVVHLYQSHYVKEKLIESDISKLLPLSDYISIPTQEKTEKTNKIAIPSRKIGAEYLEFHEFLQTNYPTIEIKNMSRFEVAKVLDDTFCYIDFGIHAGKDRMPREAAVFGNIILTSSLGTFGNSIDSRIPEELKMSSEQSLSDFKELLDNIIENRTRYKEKMNAYILQIQNQKEVFFYEVNTVFCGGYEYTFINIQSRKFRLYTYIEKGLVSLGLYDPQFNQVRSSGLWLKIKNRIFYTVNKYLPAIGAVAFVVSRLYI
ncbi:MAG: hypothetical protein ACJASR_002091 [Psychroserpens sp.]|jgi:hypothetical protein